MQIKIKRGYLLLLILVTFLFTIIGINAQNYGYLPVNLPSNAFWIWSTSYVIYHSQTYNRWQPSWSAAQVRNTTSGQPLAANWVLSRPFMDIEYPRASTFARVLGQREIVNESGTFQVIDYETFDVGYLATYLCCNSQTGQCPSNANTILSGGGTQTGQWLCGWQMQRITP